MQLLILDLETTGLDPATSEVSEVGCVLWSPDHLSVLGCYSALLPTAPGSCAEHVNGITDDYPREDPQIAWRVASLLAERAAYILAYNADFDRRFVASAASAGGSVAPWAHGFDRTWVCAMDDFAWPEESRYRDLTSVALAHRTPVVNRHRAINDCMLVASMLERVARERADFPDRLSRAFWRAEQPKHSVISMLPYDERERCRAAGFHYDNRTCTWRARLIDEEIDTLDFAVVREAELSP